MNDFELHFIQKENIFDSFLITLPHGCHILILFVQNYRHAFLYRADLMNFIIPSL